MSSTVRILFLARRTKLNKAGLATINIRITLDGKSVEFSTKIFVDPNLWNPKSGRMDGKSKTATEINNSLNAMLARLKIKHQDILDRNGYLTSEELRDVFLGKLGLRYKLLELFEEKIAQKSALTGTSLKEATVENYVRIKKRLREFILIKYSKADISIQEVNNEFILGFETYLRTASHTNSSFPLITSDLQNIFHQRVTNWKRAKNPISLCFAEIQRTTYFGSKV